MVAMTSINETDGKEILSVILGPVVHGKYSRETKKRGRSVHASKEEN